MSDKRIPLADFLCRLPMMAAAEKIPLTGRRPDLSYVGTSMEGFIAPTLSERDDLMNPAHPSVIIISASGAVGKTTLAREIAHLRQAPLWDLSEAKSVSQGAVDGMIHQALGNSAGSSFRQGLRDGTALLVVDALDEARLKSLESAFEDFILEFGQLVAEKTPSAIVLFGRTQVADLTWLLLDESKVPTAMFTIDYFDEERAIQYIDSEVRRSPETRRSMDDNYLPFAEVRDLLLGKIHRAVKDNRTDGRVLSDTGAFLGYAPVLNAVASYLKKTPNWAALKQEVSAMGSGDGSPSSSPAAILVDMILFICERERTDKILKNLKPLLAATAREEDWSDWDSLYTPKEQCERVMALELGIPTPTAWSREVPPKVATIYEEKLNSWVREHPLLRDGKAIANRVFEAYLFSRALGGDIVTLTQAVEARLCQQSYLPNRLLAEFYLLSKSESGKMVVATEHIGLLYDSMLSGETPNRKISFFLDGADPSDSGTPEELAYVEGGFLIEISGLEEENVEFITWVTPDSSLVFSRYLRNSEIILPCEIVLGLRREEFDIGPALEVICKKLRLNSQTLIVGARGRGGDAEGSAVILQAHECISSVLSKPVVHTKFLVSWPGADAFPWTEFQASGALGREYRSDSLIAEGYRRFRRIVMTLQSHKKGRLARFRYKVESQRVLQGKLGADLLATLVDDGLLYLEGNLYFWNADQAAESVGVSWQQLREGQTSIKLVNYLNRFIANRRH